MTKERFIADAEGIYGKYTPTQRKYVMHWLKDFNEKMIGMIFQEILRSLSQTLRMPPGVKEIEDALMVIRKERYVEIQDKPQLYLPEQRLPEEDVKGFFDTMKEKLKEHNIKTVGKAKGGSNERD